MFVLCFIVILLNAAVISSDSVAQGGIITSRLVLGSLQNNSIPALIFGHGTTAIQFQGDANEGLVIQSSSGPFMKFKPDNSMEIVAQQLTLEGPLNIEGSFEINEKPQWVLYHWEDFSSFKSFGWDNPNTDLVSECAGIQMLGGYQKFAKGEISKKLTNLPPHFQLRIKANFHFIDAWIGETGFMRLDIGKDGSMVYVWTDRHNQNTDFYSVNVCGSGIGEGKFTVPIDVIVTHSYDSVTFSFGSTIENDDPSDESWGVSAIEIYIR